MSGWGSSSRSMHSFRFNGHTCPAASVCILQLLSGSGQDVVRKWLAALCLYGVLWTCIVTLVLITVGVFQQSDPTLVAVFFALTWAHAVLTAMYLSRRAVLIIGPWIDKLLSVLSIIGCFLALPAVPAAAQVVGCLLGPSSSLYGLLLLNDADGSARGVSWASAGSAVEGSGIKLPPALVLGALFLNCAGVGLAVWYTYGCCCPCGRCSGRRVWRAVTRRPGRFEPLCRATPVVEGVAPDLVFLRTVNLCKVDFDS